MNTYTILTDASNIFPIDEKDLEKLNEDLNLESVFRLTEELKPLKNNLVHEKKFEEALFIRKLEILILKSIAYYAEKYLSIFITLKPSVLEYKNIEPLDLEDLRMRCQKVLKK